MKTIEDTLKGCKHDGSYIPVSEVKRLMKEYASEQCQKRDELIDVMDFFIPHNESKYYEEFREICEKIKLLKEEIKLYK